MSRHIHFQDHDMDADKVLSVDPVDTHSGKSRWEFGFTVRFPGNATTILVPAPSQFGYSGGPTRKEYEAKANQVREKFIQAVWG